MPGPADSHRWQNGWPTSPKPTAGACRRSCCARLAPLRHIPKRCIGPCMEVAPRTATMAAGDGIQAARAAKLWALRPQLLLPAVYSEDGGEGLHRGLAIRRHVEGWLLSFRNGDCPPSPTLEAPRGMKATGTGWPFQDRPPMGPGGPPRQGLGCA